MTVTVVAQGHKSRSRDSESEPQAGPSRTRATVTPASASARGRASATDRRIRDSAGQGLRVRRTMRSDQPGDAPGGRGSLRQLEVQGKSAHCDLTWQLVTLVTRA